jgi:predicted nucleic acid-binding protein
MEGLNNIPIIADSSALFSLVSKDDSNHKLALSTAAAIHKAHRPIILCGEVVSETLNIIGKKCNRELQLATADDLFGSSGFLFFCASDTQHRLALNLLKQQPNSVSFTDCLVMALAQTHHTRDIFGFDKAFEANGFRIPPYT